MNTSYKKAECPSCRREYVVTPGGKIIRHSLTNSDGRRYASGSLIPGDTCPGGGTVVSKPFDVLRRGLTVRLATDDAKRGEA